MDLPDEVAALLATPEGMERAREAVLKAFPELTPDTRTPREKALDEYRAREKAAWRTREEKLIAQAREARLLSEKEKVALGGSTLP